MSRYIISDLHLGHDNISHFRKPISNWRATVAYGAEPIYMNSEEQHQLIYESLCTVPKRATLFLLGDTAFTKEWLQKIKELPCKNKILIAGNHCVSEDTEVLTSRGWKAASIIGKQDYVASVDLKTNIMSFSPPISVSLQNHTMMSVKSGWQDELVSCGHSCVYDNKRVVVETLEGNHPTTKFKLSAHLSEDLRMSFGVLWVKLLTWVVCDGCLVQGESFNKKRVQFKLSKPRKIASLTSLLTEMGIEYTLKECKRSGVNKLQPWYIRIYGDSARMIWGKLGGVKKFPENFPRMLEEEFEAFITTLAETDGSIDHKLLNICTVSEEDSEVIQKCCIFNGLSCTVYFRDNKSGFTSGKRQYQIKIGLSGHSPRDPCIISKTGEVMSTVAISTKDQTLVTRRKGKVTVTGNCTEGGISMKDLVDVYEQVYSLHKYKGFWLSHAPIHPMELRGKRNLHGHTHPYLMLDSEGRVDNRYVNVCVEYAGYSPITWEYAISEEYQQECLKRHSELMLNKLKGDLS